MKKLFLLLAVSSLSFSSIADNCTAKTKAGENCKRSALKEDTKCFQHSDKAMRCGHITTSGNPCKIVVKSQGKKCHIHEEKNK